MPNFKSTAKNKPVRRRTRSDKGYAGEHHESSGNIFKDLERSDEEANNLLIRSRLMMAIEDIIKEHDWTQAQAAQTVGVARPRVAELLGGRIDLFSVDTLIKYLNRLGKRVNIIIDGHEVA